MTALVAGERLSHAPGFRAAKIMARLRPTAALLLEGEGRSVRPDQIRALEAVRDHGSLTAAARSLRVSYKHLWTTLKRLEAATGRSLVRRSRGGQGGGGKAALTPAAIRLLGDYRRVSRGLAGVVRDEAFWEDMGLKLSTRNRLRGTVRSVEKDRAAARILLEVRGPIRLSALITREAADDLELQAGDSVEALVKSTEVMLAKRVSPPRRRSAAPRNG